MQENKQAGQQVGTSMMHKCSTDELGDLYSCMSSKLKQYAGE